MITSKTNLKIKKLSALATKKGRRKYGEFIIEGLHMVKDAIQCNFPITEIYASHSSYLEIIKHLDGAMCDIIEVDDCVFNAISNTSNSQGIIAVAKIPEQKPLFIQKPFLVLDRIADPGNMGTILRSAAACGFDNIIIIDSVDVYNPKTVRSSSSGIFFVNLHFMNEEKFLELAKTYYIFTASSDGTNVFELKDVPATFGLVIGNEAGGVSSNIKSVSNLIAIPMSSNIESLNAGVSASILMYLLRFVKF